jgi:hypothetical protein
MKKRSATASAQKSRKFVSAELADSLPLPSESELIAKITKVLGGNLLECCAAGQDDMMLCRIPSKLKNLVFFRPDLFIIAAPEALAGDKGKVQYFVSYVLLDNQIRHLLKLGHWPLADSRFEFDKQVQVATVAVTAKSECAAAIDSSVCVQKEDEEGDILFENHNRRQGLTIESTDESESD